MPTWIWKFMINSKDIADDDVQAILEVYKELGKEFFYEQAKEKKILPFVAHTLVDFNLDVEFWSKVTNEYTVRNSAIVHVLDEAYSALKRHGVKKMFVSENFGALLSSDNDISLFASGDVDNYADPNEKEKVYLAFEELGYKRKERFSGKHQIAAEFFPPENTENLPSNFYISVDFYPLARLKLPCFIRADEFVDWSSVKEYATTSILLPPPTALMYICLLHISLHSFSRAPDIRLYIDILNMCNTAVDYSTITQWAYRDHTCVRVSTAADISNKLLKVDIPETVVNLSKRRINVEKLVYSQNENDLRYEPRGLKVMRIELACNDVSNAKGLYEMLHPDSQWMVKVYGSSGIAGHIKHIIKVL